MPPNGCARPRSALCRDVAIVLEPPDRLLRDAESEKVERLDALAGICGAARPSDTLDLLYEACQHVNGLLRQVLHAACRRLVCAAAHAAQSSI
eukprot:6203594-Prymnesium_polylepis.2